MPRSDEMIDSNEEVPKMRLVKGVTEHVPLIGPTLILLGVVRLYAYYSVFRINILNYLDFTEYLISFFNCGFILICFIVFMALFLMVKYKLKLKEDNQAAFRDVVKAETWNVFRAGCLLCSLTIIYGFITVFPKLCGYFRWDFIWGTVLSSALFIAPIWLLFYANNRLKRNVLGMSVVPLLLFLLIFDYSVNKILAYRTINENPVEVTICKEADTTRSSPTNMYIGKTAKYVLLYSVSAKSHFHDFDYVSIIPLDDIKIIQQKAKKKESIIFNSYY